MLFLNYSEKVGLEMRIDLHCHTKATKSSESIGRNVNKEMFIKKITDNQVRIVAITNHNTFDYTQYLEFVNSHFQVWPGVELDIKGNNSRGHCLLIANPSEVLTFKSLVDKLTDKSTPDTFLLTIENLCSEIGGLRLIVICHYGNKKPSLSDTDILLFQSLLSNKSAFFLEPQNLRSAGIYCAHDINAIVGSDHHDWATYPGDKTELPELKLPIDNYNKFFLLVKKDKKVIKTFLNSKLYGTIEVNPFSDCKLRIDVFNDINVIFGGKGTGKTEILKSIEKVFQQSGTSDVAKYYASDKKITYEQMTAVSINNDDFSHLNINNCSDSFTHIREWTETSLTTTKKYYDWCKTKDSESLGKNFGFINSTFQEVVDSTALTKYITFYENYKQGISDLLVENFIDYLSEIEIVQLKRSLTLLVDSMIYKVKDEFCRIKALELEKFTINKMKDIYKAKKGIESKPSGTGLLDLYANCISIHNDAHTILGTLSSDSKNSFSLLGTLIDKGNIYLKKTVSINPELINSKYTLKIGKSKIQMLRSLKNYLEAIEKHAYSDKVKESIASFNDTADSENIVSVEDFLGVIGETVKADKTTVYPPSNGEQSMLVLNYAILDDTKKFFILDEPEMSVGHKYINQVIVPRLKELARQGKVVIVSTHDANIAIRTLPFLSIYREDLGSGKYATYLGNPFIEKMYNYENEEVTVDWAKTSIDTLEGGKEAFIERGEAYGKESI